MNQIATTAYNKNNLYNTANEKLANSTQKSKGETSKKESTPSILKEDKVTISKDAILAKTREAMGLSPTGRLKREDLEAAAENQKKIISSTLASFMKNQGVETDQKISLSLDEKDRIVIKEKFPGKSELEKKLNQDTSFSLAFKSLSANNEILSYAKSCGDNMTNLTEVMNSESDWNDLFSLASRYSEIKSSSNPLATLISLGRSQEPYTFTHDPTSST